MVSTLTPTLLAEILQRAHNDNSIQVQSVEVRAACSAGEGYMSLVDRVSIQVERRDSPEQKELSLVVKSLPQNAERVAMFHSDRAFINEAAAYLHVIPALTSHPLKGSLAFPRLLYSRVHGDTDDVLVLEDLVPAGYRLAERRRGLDSAQCRLVATELARMHACSLAAKLLCPQTLLKARQTLTEVVFFPAAINSFGLSIDNSIKMAADALRREEPALAEALEKLLVEDCAHCSTAERPNGPCQNGCPVPEARPVFRRVMELLQPREPYAVIQHGDLQSNNLFFSYLPDGTVDKMKMLDLQILRYSSPLVDVLHFVSSSCAELKELQSDTASFLVLYHAALETALVQLGVEPTTLISGVPVCPSLRWLHEEADRLGLYGLAVGLMLLPAMTVAAEHAVDLESMEKREFHSEQHVATLSSQLPPEYTRRARLIAQEAVRIGLI